MRKSEAKDVGQLAGAALAGGGALVERMHLGIAERAFTYAPAPFPVRQLHDGISRAVYSGVRGCLRGAARTAGQLAAARASADGPALHANPPAARALAALNGLYGDRIADRAPALAVPMEIRRRGAAVPVTADALARAFPDATSRLVVLVHGLAQNEDAWRFMFAGGRRRDRRAYGERLQDELSYTPVYVRYNSGLAVAENARKLAHLLEDLTREWPVAVEEVVLIGHSVGGLICRGACDYGERQGKRFNDAVRHVFCLGTPQLGTYLERGAGTLASVLRRLPETRALGELLDARSLGIKDLRLGSGLPSGRRPRLTLTEGGDEVEFLADIDYCFIGGPPTGLHHFALLNHPAVYAQLRRRLTGQALRPPAALPAPRPPAALLGA